MPHSTFATPSSTDDSLPASGNGVITRPKYRKRSRFRRKTIALQKSFLLVSIRLLQGMALLLAVLWPWEAAE